MKLAVLEGDQATHRDAQRIEAAGCRALQITPKRESVVFVENVGYLVCPALFDLGERAKVVVMSVTEGEDQPMKYRHVFEAADLFVLNKIDLQPLVQLDVLRCFEFAKQVNPKIRTMRVSARTGQGVDTFCDWIRTEVRS